MLFLVLALGGCITNCASRTMREFSVSVLNSTLFDQAQPEKLNMFVVDPSVADWKHVVRGHSQCIMTHTMRLSAMAFAEVEHCGSTYSNA